MAGSGQSEAEAHPIYTIGHSTRPIEAFVEILRLGKVRRLVDVRSIPRSRTNPQYNLDVLPERLAAWQISHTIIPELGGRRGRQKAVPPEVNGYWRNRSFHNYADYALSKGFRAGLEELMVFGRERRTAVMCSEAVWWRCHRRIVADHLIASGEAVYHLMDGSRAEPARLSGGAVLAEGVLTYPSST